MQYTPTAVIACSESILYTVADEEALTASAAITLNVTGPANQPPVANDATVQTQEDTELLGTLTATDSDANPLEFSIPTPGGPAKGQVVVTSPTLGTYRYIPNPNATGTDQFTFAATDQIAVSQAVVTVEIAPVNDPPVLSVVPPKPVKVGQAFVLPPPSTNDPDPGDTLIFSFANCPQSQSAVCDPDDGSISGTPNASDIGVTRGVRISVRDSHGASASAAGFDIVVLADSGAPVTTRSVAEGPYPDSQQVSLECEDPEGGAGNCSIFFALGPQFGETEISPDRFLRSSGAGKPQLRGEVFGASSAVAGSPNFRLNHALGQPGAVGVTRSARFRLRAGVASVDSDLDGQPDFEDLFPNDPVRYLPYLGPFEIASSAVLRTRSRDPAGNTEVVESTQYIIDRDPPMVTILNPLDNSTNDPLFWVIARASDAGSGIASVAVEITDGTNFLTSEGSFSERRASAATDIGGERWLSLTGAVPFEPNTVYSIAAIARDGAGNESTDSVLVSLTDDALLALTRLSLEVSKSSLLVDGAVSVAGRLTRLPDIGLSLGGRRTELTVANSDGDIVTELETETLDALGSYRLNGIGGFARKGEYQLRARFPGTALLAESIAERTVQVSAGAGHAILVQGKPEGTSPLPAHARSLDRLYAAMRARGFLAENITYLAYGDGEQIDGRPSRVALEAAITNTVEADSQTASRLIDNPAPLVLALVGPIAQGGLRLDSEIVTPNDIDTWLDLLEAQLAVHAPEALEEPRTIIVEGTRAGGFLSALSASGRTVVASTRSEDAAYQGPIEATPDPDGSSRDAGFFLNELVTRWAEGRPLAEAFSDAAQAARARTQSETSSIATALQRPAFDDNGDGDGSETVADVGGDGAVAGRTFLDVGDPVVRIALGDVAPTLALGTGNGDTSALLWAKTNLPPTTGSAWVEIRTPSLTLQPDVDELPAVVPFERVALDTFNAAPNRWEANHDGFTEPGRYDITYFAANADMSELAAAATGIVFKDGDGNKPPGSFLLQSPSIGAQTATALFLTWGDAVDPEGETVRYSVVIATDPAFARVALQVEDLSATSHFISLDDGLADATEVFWKVIAIDPLGAATQCDSRSFFTDNTNGAFPGLIQGRVFNSFDGASVPGAQISAARTDVTPSVIVDNTSSLADGRYRMVPPAGILDISVGADNFEPATVAQVRLPEGVAITVDVGLRSQTDVDLAVTVDYAPRWTRVGEPITYTVTVRNNGSSSATEVILTSDLVGATFSVNSITAPTCAPTAEPPITCELGSLGAGAVSQIIIEATPNSPAENARHEVNVIAAQADRDPSDNEGVAVNFAVLDANNNGVPDVEDPDPTVASAHFSLGAGLNLIVVPIDLDGITNARELLVALGELALSVSRLDVATGQWVEILREGNDDGFDLIPGEGYAVLMEGPLAITLNGQAGPRTVDLGAGTNLVGFVVDTSIRAFELLEALGGPDVAISVLDFDPRSGRHQFAAFGSSGAPIGSNFPVERGVAYFIATLEAINDFELP